MHGAEDGEKPGQAEQGDRHGARRFEDLGQASCAKRFPWRDAFCGENDENDAQHEGGTYGQMLYKVDGATLDDLREAAAIRGRRSGPRGACSVARTRPQRTLNSAVECEPCSPLARRRAPNGRVQT